jgi:hypothetical protein
MTAADLDALENVAHGLRNEVLLLRALSYLGRDGFRADEWKDFDQSFIKAIALSETLEKMIAEAREADE